MLVGNLPRVCKQHVDLLACYSWGKKLLVVRGASCALPNTVVALVVVALLASCCSVDLC